MSKPFSAAAGCTAVLLLFPLSAAAEVSALEVWENWKSYAETFGQTVTADSQQASGDTLTLSGVKIAMQFPDGQMAGTLDTLEFRERGDGTVAVTLSPDFPISLSVQPPDGEALDLGIIIRQTGISIIASGEADDLVYDYLAAEIGIAVEKMVVGGVDIDPEIAVTMRDLDGRYTSAQGERNDYTSDLGVAGAEFNVSVTDPEGGGNLSMAGTISDLNTSSVVSVASDFDPEDPAQVFGGALTVSGSMTAGGTEYRIALDDGDDSFAIVTSSQGSTLNVALDKGALEYGGSSSGLEYKVSAAQLPFPELTFALAEAAFNLLMPMAPSDGPADFGLLVKLAGLEIDDMLWSVFDAAGQLPRDPATLILDIGGQMKWLVDITDPEAAEAAGDEIPAELYRLDLNNVTVAAVGAEITGEGSATFDNSDLETFDGLPAPTGKFEFTIVGINGLLDKLIAMGLLPEDQAMGARMMLGLFARPGGGEDTLVSTIEVQPDGSVFANGQQLQ